MAERDQLEHAIAHIEAQRPLLGDAAADAAIAGLRQELVALDQTETSTSDLHGERRQATILLADVVGSTALAERVDTESWVETMNRVFHLLGEAIYHYGGEIEQYRGDGLMAFFGAKGAHEDDPERAVRAGLAMQDAVQTYAAELETQRGIELLLRVGVNTGEVIAAEVGDRRRHSEDTAMGRAVALAARMESAAQPGTVLVTANTYHLTQRLFEWQALGEIAVKGVSQPVKVYRPLAARATEGKGRGIEGLSSPLVGREEELAALRQAIDDLQRGVGGIVTLVGEAGIGKSRLVAELRKRVAGDQVRWLEGRCLSYGGSIAYLPWLDMLRGVLRVAHDAPSEVVRAALRAQVQALCPACYDAVYPYLCRLMSLPLEDEYGALRDLQGESLRAEVFSALQALVEGAARQAPSVLVFEDLHWADATSLALLERVLALTDHAPLLVLLVFRPVVEHGCWQLKETIGRLYRHRHTDLSLDALSTEESKALVSHLLVVEDLPPALRAVILERAEGNPFYVEEIIRTLIDDGAIVRDDARGRWRATREVAHIPVPDTLHGVLAGRIDRLETETRRVLRMASVIGRVFPYRILAEIAGDGSPLPAGEPLAPLQEASREARVRALDARLVTLQRQQLIRERARVPELEYIFKHELTREAAYDGLLLRDRRASHRQVAEALERLYPDRLEEQLGLLAHHWDRAGEPERAIPYLLRAGAQAAAASANVEAVTYYERVLALVGRRSGRALVSGCAVSESGPVDRERTWRQEALRGLGQGYVLTGRPVEAEQCLREAIELGQETGLAVGEMARLYHWLGEAFFWQARWDERIRVGQEGLALLGEDRASVEAALMNQAVAVGYQEKGDWSGQLAYTYRTAAFLEQLPYAEELAPAYTHVYLAYLMDRDVVRAEWWIRTLGERASPQRHIWALMLVPLGVGVLFRQMGDLQGAIAQLVQGAELAARVDSAGHVNWSLTQAALAALSLGDYARAEAYARRALEAATTLGTPHAVALARCVIGETCLAQGDVEQAMGALHEAARLLEGINQPWFEAGVLHQLAQAYLARGERAGALRHLHRAVDLIAPEAYNGYRALHWLMDMVAPYPLIAHLLCGLEHAYDDPRAFQRICDRCREQAGEGPFVGWYLARAALRWDPGAPVQDLGWRPGGAAGIAPKIERGEWIWHDPVGDCTLALRESVELRAANGRDLWAVNWGAPRLLQSASGDWVVETACAPLSSTMPAIGGLVLWADERNYLRLDRGAMGERDVLFGGCIANRDLVIGRGRLPLWDPVERAGSVMLRLERVGDRVEAYCSVDGERWFTAGAVRFPVEDPVQVGVHAIGSIDRTVYRGAYPEGTAIRFESFQMWQMRG